MPLIHGCDAHTEDKLFEPDLQRYCWIKAEATFEGLKQIIHEPNRVVIQESHLDNKNNYEVIDKIKVNIDDIFNESIEFNPDLNSIIGGRSSGKSTLLQLIAKKLSPNEPNIPKHVLSDVDNINILWKDGKEDDERQIEYFCQGHMYEKSSLNGIENIITDVIKQISSEIFESYQNQKNIIKQEISNKINELYFKKKQLNDDIYTLKSIGNYDDVKNQITELSQTVQSSSTTSITDDEQKTFNEIEQELRVSKQEIDENQSLLNVIDTKDIDSFYEIKEITEFNQSQIIKEKYEQLKTELDEIIRNKLSEFKEETKSQVNANIIDSNKKVEGLENDITYKKVRTEIESSNALKPIITKLAEEKNKLNIIEELNSNIQKNSNNIEVIKEEIQNNWKNYYQINQTKKNAINNLDVETDLDIFSTVIFHRLKFNDFLTNSINQQSDKAQSYLKVDIKTPDNLIATYDEISKSIDDNTLKLKNQYTKEKLYKEFYETNWFGLSYDVQYEGDSYNQMSQGKKAFVVLKLSLDCSKKTCPILIDQPEDDLDNRAIYSELVKYLKQKKLERQIILVTHNANVVVNADSEQVIVANQHGNKSINNNSKKFQYKTGSIESLEKSNEDNCSVLDGMTIKEHICEILEGGDKAFKLREKRYELKS